MTDVFVSYKAEDRRRIAPLVSALEADGFSVWWDQQIDGGAAWRRMIEAELNAARSVIVAWSKRSVGEQGEFVQDEATRAQQRRVYIPVTIGFSLFINILELLVAFIQAYIFTMLTAVFTGMGMASHDHEHGDEGHAAAH